MKSRIIAVLVCVMAFFASESISSAKHNVGVIGGCTFSTGFKDIQSSTLTQYHAGLAFKFRLPLGFAIQPSILYMVKGSKFDDISNINIGYLEVPVALQWGPDLVICRPYVEFAPFVGYGLNNSIKDWTDLNRVEYGVGLGGGIDIWRFQINARYHWNFGSLAQANIDDAAEEVKQAFKNKNFGGVTLSLAFYF